MIYAVFGDQNANNRRVWRWRLNADLVARALDERLRPLAALERTRASAATR